MAFIISEEVMLFVGVVVLVICIIFDVFMAYRRGAKWLPGYAVLLYALFLQLIGYLDVQNVSMRNRHKDQKLELLVSNQVSIDTSRLVLLVFVGYLVPNLASIYGVWVNIAALFTGLSTHMTIELSIALQSRVSEKDKVVKGQSGIWVIVSGFVMLESIFCFSWLIVRAISRGRFIRDNLGMRISLALTPENNSETMSALKSPENNSETISALKSPENNCEIISALNNPENDSETMSTEVCKSEMLKSWILTRVSQPEYVLKRSMFSFEVACVVTFDVMFMGVKVILLRSQLHGSFPLFTLQCIFIVLGWVVVSYRCFLSYVVRYSIPPQVQNRLSFDFDRSSIMRYFSPIVVLRDKIEKRVKKLGSRSVVEIGQELFLFLFLPLLCILLCVPLLCILFLSMGYLMIILVVCPMFKFGLWVLLRTKRFRSAPRKDEDFQRYRKALELVCMPDDNAESLWVQNESSFNHIMQCIWKKAYDKGQKGAKLQKVIGRIAQNIPLSKDAKELLKPLDCVNIYFPLLKDSFRRITAMVLLMDDNV
ncbi:hypothetical protein SUGI_0091360 [Cryptomeria japonica]|nr:hypothetical protein SUGI_0091360 [Cryptomeria japonica]